MSEYVPFGDEWKKHVAKLPKRELVEMLAKALNEKQETQLKLYALQKAAEQSVHPTLLYECEDCGSVDPQVHYSNCPRAKTQSG